MSAFTQTGPIARPSGPRSRESRLLSVLHAVAPVSVGGLERVVQSLCIGLRRREHTVHVALVTDQPAIAEGFEAPLAAAGVSVHRVLLPARAYFQERRELGRLAAELRPDVLHTHGHRPDLLAAWAARQAGIPTITTLHGFTGGGWKMRLYEQVQRMALARFDAVVAVSRPLAEQVARRSVAPQRLHVIPNAWLEAEAPLGRAAARRALALAPGDHKVVGWVGRLSRAKGPDLALNALALLPDLPITLAVVGDGPERAELERMATRLGVTARVHWCGRVADAGRLFGAFDLFLLTSRTEGTPMVLFEAMAARTPIVATAVGGVTDVLPRGTALAVPPENPDALAHAIRSVLRCPRHATARATAARTRLLTQYEPQRWLDAYEALYRKVLCPGSPASASG